MTQNLKSNTKLTHVFLEIWLASFISKVQIVHENAIVFFFSKMHILLYHPHLSQVFTILLLPSIHQPPWTTNLKLLMHLKINLHSFFPNFYELKTTFIYFISIFIQKNQNFDFKFFKVHWAIEGYDSRWVTFVWASMCVEKSSVC